MEKLFDYIASTVDDAELYQKKDNILTIEIKQGKIKAVDGKNVIGLSLRMNKDNRPGSAVSTSLDDLSIVDRAITSSLYKNDDTYLFKSTKAEEVNCYDSDLAEMTAEELIAKGNNLSQRIKVIDDSVTFMITIERTLSEVAMMNTAGLNDCYNKSVLKIAIATMSEAGFVQGSYTETYSKLFEISDEKIKEMIRKHNISNKTFEIESKKMPVVFTGKAMGALMTRLLAGVNGEFIAKGVSPIASKVGEQIAAPCFNVADDGRLSHGFSTMKFDDEGTPTQRTSIIENGILKNILVSVATEEKLEAKATGNSIKKTMFSKEIEDKPAIDSSNFMITPGEFADEEIIKSIEYGILVDTVMGTHTGNIPAGEYALNVSIGYLIEKGKIVGKILDTMVSGNIYEDLFKIESVGKNLELMHVVFYPMGYAPMVKFNDINVVGSK
jgi:PmbA protein